MANKSEVKLLNGLDFWIFVLITGKTGNCSNLRACRVWILVILCLVSMCIKHPGCASVFPIGV